MQSDLVDGNIFKRVFSKIVTLPLALALLMAVVFAGIVFQLIDANRYVVRSEKIIGSAHEILELMVDAETGLRGYVITGKESFLDPYQVASQNLQRKFHELKTLLVDNPQNLERIEEVEKAFGEWLKYAAEVVNLKRNRSGADSLVNTERGKVQVDAIRMLLSDFFNDADQMLSNYTSEAERSAKNSLILILSFSIIVGLILAWNSRKQLYVLSDNYDKSFQKQNELNISLQKEAWIRRGQGQVSLSLLGEHSRDEIGEKVLKVLAEFVEIQLGALYAVSDIDNSIQLAATYAYPDLELRQQFANNFAKNESLLGQSIRDNKALTLRDVPENYSKITSGSGAISPKHLMILPLAVGDEVRGALELGFLKAPNEDGIELLKRVSENIGLALQAASNRERLQDYLEKTQMMNEELQTQQEELKTSNEELQEQSKALQESQVKLENQQQELEQTNDQLEKQAEVLGEQRDTLNERNLSLNKAQVQLEERAQEIQRASRYKSEFLANMSHELRTPLNSSLILAKLLSDNNEGNLTSEQVQFANSIYSSGNDLLNLINDILDLSKVEAGKLEIRPEEVNLRKFSDSLKQVFAPLAKNKALDFVITLESGVPESIFTDNQRLHQILKNLLSNAIKFTDQGFVKLRVYREDSEHCCFAVMDSGIGINTDQQSIIFEAFHQADGTTNRKYGGTGLGLSISRDLAKLLGASIVVKSQPGQGSTFLLRMPVKYSGEVRDEERVSPPENIKPSTPTEHLPPPRVEPSLPPFADDREVLDAKTRTILIVEDDVASAQIIFNLAHELKFKALVSTSAEDGFQVALKYKPDAILLDIKLPDNSGLTVLDQLKVNPTTRHIPVHIVSATDTSGTALLMGAIGHLKKPFDREKIRAVFAKLEEKFSQKIKRILVVEDDPTQREAICSLIGDEGIKITAVGMAREALAQLKDSIFDCMIIDLTLPDMSGFELLEKMSSNDFCSFPPVIVYTGKDLSRDDEGKLRKYSRTIIIKGARSPERLLDEVTLFLHQVESKMPPERQRMLRTARSREKVFEGRKILLVDDDARNIFALSSALEQKGALVEIARNGKESLQKLENNSGIDIILMDIMMPEMNGYEAIREIRKNPQHVKIPIIAVTAKAMRDDQEKCLEAGANDYLSKPIELDKLFSLIRVWMPKIGSL